MSNVSILMHKFGAAPESQVSRLSPSQPRTDTLSSVADILTKCARVPPLPQGSYTVHNRMMGQISAAEMTTCSQARCQETLRPYPCACAGGGSWHTLLPQPKQIHVVSHTPAYAMSAVQFSPNDAFVANCQQRGTGLVFANGVHTTVALPHLTGEKWGLLDQDVMLVQRCGSCNYGGSSLYQIFNASRVWQEGEWWFAQANDDHGAAIGWAAMRAAWGGTNFTNTTSAGHALLSGTVNLHDTWSPLVLVAAMASTYGSLQNFSDQIALSKLSVAGDKSHVEYAWQGRRFGFTPGPETWKGTWQLPTIDDKLVDIDPPFVYRSPHLNAELDSEVVTASYGSYVLVYNFTDNTVRRQ